MREISTNNLHEVRPVIRADRELCFGNLAMPASELVLQLAPGHLQQITDHIQIGLNHFHELAGEQTLVNSIMGRPTMVARIDCTITSNNEVHPYEIEERPSGIAASDALLKPHNQGGTILPVVNHFFKILGRLPVVAASCDRMNKIDDVSFLGVLPIETINDSIETPLLLRCEPDDIPGGSIGKAIVCNSIASARREGDKRYRATTGFGRLVSDHEQLPQGQSLVVKAVQGSKSQLVSINLSGSDRKRYGKKGTVTRSRLERDTQDIVNKQGIALMESFVAPIQVKMADTMGNMILRIFALVHEDSVQVIGGTHVTRPEAIVHGASNVISGPVVVG